MEHSEFDRILAEVAPETTEQKKTARPRQLTTLKLQWIAERVRKIERIRKAVADGSYCVDSNCVARAVLGLDQEK